MKRLGASLTDSGDPNDPYSIINAIRRFAHSKAFTQYAEATALKMVTHLFTDSGRTWRQAARASSQGRMIYEALQKEMQGPLGYAVRDQVERNAAIIKSLPLDVAKQVNYHILSESMKGKRASDLAEEIIKFFPETSSAKANLIARTETSKTSTALTQARSEMMGVNWYVWRTAEDGNRVRKSHQLMDRVLVSWNDAPSPEKLNHEKHAYGNYQAGEIFNCRCYAEPIIDLDLISWPARVYRNGAIVSMTRKQFEMLNAGTYRVAAVALKQQKGIVASVLQKLRA